MNLSHRLHEPVFLPISETLAPNVYARILRHPTKGWIPMHDASNPHDREYAAAVSGLADQTVTPEIQFGMRVTVPRVFGDGVQSGTVAKLEHDRHLGATWLIDTPQGRLKYLPSEITYQGWPF